jgi:hypothetical protein
MASTCRLGIVSDIHYACAAEQARGSDYELSCIPNPFLRLAVRFYRRYIWLNQPLKKNYLLDRFLERSGPFDFLVANGEYSCDSISVGVCDEASCQSGRECLTKLRSKFGERLRLNFGDHELGKVSFFGGRGGMRLASWDKAQSELGLEPFWQQPMGRYLLVGVVSSLIALPVYEPDTLPEERREWERLRAEHLTRVRATFDSLQPDQRVLLFCHDPTALPFLWEEPSVRAKITQVENTVIGHLHSDLVFWKSRLLAGMPRITFLGHTAKRLSSALRRGRLWRPFHVRLCPSIAGVELLKDGGYLSVDLDLDAARPAQFCRHHLPR